MAAGYTHAPFQNLYRTMAQILSSFPFFLLSSICSSAVAMSGT